jgi:polyhydroxyalkanoate synthesis regulator phasin
MSMTDRFDARRAQMIRELQSEMADLVEAGEMTAQEANEWVNAYADRSAREG